MLIWIIIHELYSPYIESIKCEKNIVADTLSRLTINANQETTQESIYKNEIVSEIDDTKELPDGNSPMSVKLVGHYQQGNVSLKTKNYMVTYPKGYFCGVSNININLITCVDQIVFL